MTTPSRPPVLAFLLLFFGMLAVALGLAAASPSDDQNHGAAAPAQRLEGEPAAAHLR